MAKSDQLRVTRLGTVINLTSRQQETDLGVALVSTLDRLQEEFGVKLNHKSQWPLDGIVNRLRGIFAEVEFYDPSPKRYLKPDGGIVALIDHDGSEYPVLISEVKNQGTNDRRMEEGLKKQAMGNAVERLGKNVIGFRTAMLHEAILPFVCFGYGIDFDEGSSILDRVHTIAMFGELNTTYLANTGESGLFNRGSFYFRRRPWTFEEIADVMYDIGSRSIYYYFAKYGKESFV